MFTLLTQFAFAADSAAETVFDFVEEGRVRTVNAATHLGFDVAGPRPGISGRVDLGHRVSVDGVVFAGLPMAQGLKWTGGAGLGVSLAPLHVQFGHKGSLDLRLGVGGSGQTRSGVTVSLGDLKWSTWVSGVVEISPDSRWTFYGGVLTDPLAKTPSLNPTGGVRLRLD